MRSGVNAHLQAEMSQGAHLYLKVTVYMYVCVLFPVHFLLTAGVFT